MSGGGEADALARLRRLLPTAPPGEVWFGDDAAVLAVPPTVVPVNPPSALAVNPPSVLLLAADAVVGGIDADLTLTSLADLGWKAMAVNLSDIAAMGGRPAHAVVSVVGLSPPELEALYGGVLEASAQYTCPIVGGDLSAGDQVVVSVAITGWADGPPVLRSTARPGDRIWVTGRLGAATAGLRWLQEHRRPVGLVGLVPPTGAVSVEAADCIRAHARPRPAVAEGLAARALGATAMIDVSDGLVADLGHIADSSGVGFDLVDERDLPVAPGASIDDALGGGDDYVLAFTLPADVDAAEAFGSAGLPAPFLIGTCVGDPTRRCSGGRRLAVTGWEHKL